MGVRIPDHPLIQLFGSKLIGTNKSGLSSTRNSKEVLGFLMDGRDCKYILPSIDLTLNPFRRKKRGGDEGILEEEFNLLATTARGFELKGLGELWDLLREVGDDKAEVKISEISGIVIAKTSLDPLFFVEKVKEIVSREPWKVKNLLRLIPLERNVKADLNVMKEKLKEIKDKIAIHESFRITVEKRYTNLSSKEIIEALAEIVDRKVSLEEPDWIVLVEIVKNRAGISVLKEDQIVSFVKLKRA